MTKKDLTFFKTWFTDYTRSFLDTTEEDRRNFELKIEHSLHVAANIAEIAGGLELDRNDMFLAEALGLFHDIGRFPQYAKFRTFQDRKSKNHGLLGALTLTENNVLGNLPRAEQTLIIKTVKFHNAFAIPNIFDDYSKLFLKLIRDADKLDIFRVFIKYYESPPEEKASETAFGLPDTDEYSKILISNLKNMSIASYRSLRSENDFKLLKLSWIYGMHFNYSLKLVRENDYIKRIAEKLPRTDEIRSAVTEVENYVKEKINK